MLNLRKKFNLKLLKHNFFKQYIRHKSNENSYRNWLNQYNDNKVNLYSIEIFDIIDNDDMNKLIKKLYKLNKSKFIDVKTPYKKSFLTKFIYTRVQIDYTSTGLLADINLKNNNFIRNIFITHTQINNNEFIISYEFNLKKEINSYSQIGSFVEKNIDFIKKSSTCTCYLDKNFFKKIDKYEELLELDFNLFRDYFQSFIENNSYSKIGKLYRLPIIFNNYLSSENINKDDLKIAFLTECYSDRKETEFLQVNSLEIEGPFIDRYTLNYYGRSGFLEYFSNYGNEFYFQVFNRIETNEIERRLGKYFSNKKKSININDHKWLINKIRCIKERKIIRRDKYNDRLFAYDNVTLTRKQFINYSKYTGKYLKIYTEYLDYLNSINILRYNSILLYVTVATLAATFLSIIVSILLSKIPH